MRVCEQKEDISKGVYNSTLNAYYYYLHYTEPKSADPMDGATVQIQSAQM